MVSHPKPSYELNEIPQYIPLSFDANVGKVFAKHGPRKAALCRKDVDLGYASAILQHWPSGSKTGRKQVGDPVKGNSSWRDVTDAIPMNFCARFSTYLSTALPQTHPPKARSTSPNRPSTRAPFSETPGTESSRAFGHSRSDFRENGRTSHALRVEPRSQLGIVHCDIKPQILSSPHPNTIHSSHATSSMLLVGESELLQWRRRSLRFDQIPDYDDLNARFEWLAEPLGCDSHAALDPMIQTVVCQHQAVTAFKVLSATLLDRPYAPAPRQCFGLTSNGRCTSQPNFLGFCTSHQEQAMWLNPLASHISASQRRAHAEGRRCCGLTKKFALCRNNPGGNFSFCWLHGGQRPLEGVGPAAGQEPPQTAMVRERMCEFFRIQRESEYEARDQWARKEQRRHEQERARAEREEQDRQRWREYLRQHQEQQEGARRERQRQEESQREQSRSHQRQRRYGARNADDNRQSDREQQRRERAQNANQAQDFEFHAKILQRYLSNSTVFDGTAFPATNPNTFSRVPWPVFPRLDSTVGPSDITPENVRRFFGSSTLQRFKTAREIDVILKNTIRRFHEDRFRANRPIISSIRDVGDRDVVIQAAKIVVQTINAGRSI
ncbi:hypothetical protein K438DRAFT_1755683 [Mycena galopus ATCC 62051]|nr:hypothetical protein K438DRAFT_1755683 [Mycena galopus ATCC 62051]